MHAVHSAISAELVAQRDRSAPIDRHFFAAIGIGGTRIDRAKLDRWNTYGELLGAINASATRATGLGTSQAWDAPIDSDRFLTGDV